MQVLNYQLAIGHKSKLIFSVKKKERGHISSVRGLVNFFTVESRTVVVRPLRMDSVVGGISSHTSK